ncbi:hypothetical protein GYMLUDRAFT_52990 [Collybiopsis luxurians FD-317 M1]|nr:hypothetical protein GYMLUDRAFT_52990 [Collybiopsis luxurians FD-317 M1]
MDSQENVGSEDSKEDKEDILLNSDELSELEEEEDQSTTYEDLISGKLTDLESTDSETPTTLTAAPTAFSSLPPPSLQSLTSDSSSLSSQLLHSKKRKRKRQNEKQKANKQRYNKDVCNAKCAKLSDRLYSKGIGQKWANELHILCLDVDTSTLLVASTSFQGICLLKLYADWIQEKVLKKLKYIDWDVRYMLHLLKHLKLYSFFFKAIMW